MQITYVFHSCFVVETDRVVIVYDYWRDLNEGDLLRRLCGSDKSVYFVVSHFHHDHFNEEIFKVTNAFFLVSYDVLRRKRIPENVDFHELRPGYTFKDQRIEVHSFRSTDIGVCTLLSLPEVGTVFHAGDCNNWYFKGENNLLKVSPENMDKLFRSILRDVYSVAPSVDHVMFPLDPRLGEEMVRGVVQWLDTIKTGVLYPMHYWNEKQIMLEGVELLKLKFPDTFFYVP